jgi:hypothetical protein
VLAERIWSLRLPQQDRSDLPCFPPYAEDEWFQHRNQRSIEVADSAGFWGSVADGFSAWGDFDPPDAAQWLGSTERGTPWRAPLAWSSPRW